MEKRRRVALQDCGIVAEGFQRQPCGKSAEGPSYLQLCTVTIGFEVGLLVLMGVKLTMTK
jgi:hypothetical protein